MILFLLPGSGSTFPEVDPDPAKSSGSRWIRIHNTVFTCPWTQLRLVSSEFHLIPCGNSNLKQYKNINFPDNINFKDNITIINITLHYNINKKNNINTFNNINNYIISPYIRASLSQSPLSACHYNSTHVKNIIVVNSNNKITFLYSTTI